MARGGWLDRINPANWIRDIADAIGKVLGGESEPPRAPREQKPREPQPAPRPKRQEAPRDPFRQAWVEERLQRAGRGYQANKEVFLSLPGMVDESPDEQQRLWRLYLRYMVRGDVRRNSIRDNPFWRETNIHPDTFDWAEWREAMNYKMRHSA
jgi:hypothetical protein